MGRDKRKFVVNICIHISIRKSRKGHSGIKDFSVQVIDVTDVNNPTERESFWIEKLKTYIPMGLNVREEN